MKIGLLNFNFGIQQVKRDLEHYPKITLEIVKLLFFVMMLLEYIFYLYYLFFIE